MEPADLTNVGPDPLGVLHSTVPIVRWARDVRIDPAAIARFVDSFGGQKPLPPVWDTSVHFHDDSPGGAERVAGWIFALDALNFCFWSVTDDRWRVRWYDETYDGYMALAAALMRAVEDGYPLWDTAWLRQVSIDEVRHILRPVPGSPAIPLLELRYRHLRELGDGLGNLGGADLVRQAGGSGIELIAAVLRCFPSFRDVAIGPDGLPVHFYKRAQILIADLAGSLVGTDLGLFHDRHLLTAFADYKVPQVLRRLGVLVYSPDLTSSIGRRELIEAGSRAELEIRAATIWSCELIRQAVRGAGTPMTAQEIDWLLWTTGQALPPGSEPYHRTLTPFY